MKQWVQLETINFCWFFNSHVKTVDFEISKDFVFCAGYNDVFQD